MKENIIKHGNIKNGKFLMLINLIVLVIYVILAATLITTVDEKITNITVVLVDNLLISLILYGFSLSNTNYETVYQIKIDNKGYQPKLYRYLLILFAFAGLIFFLTNAFYMFFAAGLYHNNINYLLTLQNNWGKLLIITFYHIALIATHRQLLHYAINHQKLLGEKKSDIN